MNLTRRSTLGILGALFSAGAFAHGRRTQHGAMDDERIERFIRHLAVDLDATAEQQQKLTEIAKGAAHDLAPLRTQSMELRKQGVALFTAASIDKNAVEQLRVKRMQNADAISRRMTRALTDTAEVLTPEQRKKAAERAGHWRHFG
jgi:Spy/CpxP family protein refolding chaperone